MKICKILTSSYRPTEIYHFKPEDIDRVVNEYLNDYTTIRSRKKINGEWIVKEVINAPISFDIETTSTVVMGNKCAFMYCWSMSINGGVIFGRTWDQFDYVLSRLQYLLQLNERKTLIVYVHNLSFEFQFLRKRLKWTSVFSLDQREPVKAVSDIGIEFRCSYKLSGYSLSALGERLTRYPVKKLTGDLDYRKIRHSDTPMTEKEIGYCVNDVLVVTSYIQERIEIDGDITKIPLTKTGYVRQDVRKECLPTDKARRNEYYKYRRCMDYLTLTPELYKQLKRAYHGGFTHANAWYVQKEIKNVSSYDFTSSYPTIICSEKFPMSMPQKVYVGNWETFKWYLKNRCCLFDCEIIGVQAKRTCENSLSFSKCWNVQTYILNNGRIVSAGVLQTTFTETDFLIFNKFYSYDRIRISSFSVFRKAYLPRPIVEKTIEYYEKKTTLKDVPGAEVDYMQSKENVNSIYGMMVTDPCRDEIIYDNDEWKKDPSNVEECLERYNKSKNRFLWYPWGIWITAYAQRNLFTGIDELDADYIYADTDSVKFINAEDHKEYFDRYNKEITKKINACLRFHKIDPARACPKTIKGKEKPLGIWDKEPGYDRAKFLGAKRYMVEKDGKLSLTVSGLNKGKTVPYLLKTYGSYDEVFKQFDENLYIPAEISEVDPITGETVYENPTGKNTHTYIDEPQDGYIQDYLGNWGEFHEKSSCHISPAEYSLSFAKAFVDYLKGIRDKKA